MKKKYVKGLYAILLAICLTVQPCISAYATDSSLQQPVTEQSDQEGQDKDSSVAETTENTTPLGNSDFTQETTPMVPQTEVPEQETVGTE